MTDRTITLTFTPDFRTVDLVRAALQGICRELFEPDGGAFTFELALAATEAMNNVAEHSGASVAELEVAADEEGVVLRLASPGERFDSSAAAAMPDDASDPDGAEGGYGLALIQELVDRLEFVYENGRNVLTLYKRFNNEGITKEG